MFKKSILITAIGLTIAAGLFSKTNSKMKSINNNAPVVCSKTITINAGKEKVWAVLSNINNWATWQTDIRNPQLNGELKPTTTFDWKTGGAKIHSSLHTVDEYNQLGWTGKSFGMFAIHNWTLTETNGVTEIHVNESMEGFLAKVFKKALNNSLENGMQNWLELLKKECEAQSNQVLSKMEL